VCRRGPCTCKISNVIGGGEACTTGPCGTSCESYASSLRRVAEVLVYPVRHMHIAPDVLPVLSVVANCPHDVQVVALLPAVLNVPTKHAVNGPPTGPAKPALATQAASAELPAGEDEPVAQGWHVEPAREYVPAPQAVQAASAVLLPAEEEPAGQFWHVEPAREYFPAAQAVQAASAELLPAEEEPAGQF
jgi:hypothetical protein